jgi:hypothetical protein
MVDSDVFSVHELDLMMLQLGHTDDEVMYYNFKIPGQNLDIGLRALGCDADVINMLQYVQMYKSIELYIEHKVSRVNTYLQSPNMQPTPRVFSEEIDANAPPIRQLLLEWVDDEVQQNDGDQV